MKDGRIRPKSPTALSARALLQRWIERGRLNQTEAAQQIGISRVKLNQYLNSEARPSLETAVRIEDATGIGVRLWLVDHADEMRLTDGNQNGLAVAPETPREGNTEVNHNIDYRTQTSRFGDLKVSE